MVIPLPERWNLWGGRGKLTIGTRHAGRSDEILCSVRLPRRQTVQRFRRAGLSRLSVSELQKVRRQSG